MSEIVFFTALSLLVYAYLLFPLLLLVRGLIWRRGYKTAEITPRVSIVIVAYNEAESIGAKLDNLLALDYPADRREIIVASDGSDDGMNDIVRSYAGHGVRLLEFPRQGKVPSLNAAVEQTCGDVLVFTDANSMFTAEALRKLVAPLADPQVGAVAGNQRYTRGAGNAASIGERLYWKFDRALKRMQSKSGSVIAATGAIHAIRRELFQPAPPGVCDDFVISARAIEQGYRLAFEPEAIAEEPTAPTDGAEFSRRVRIIVRGLGALWVLRRLFNPFRYGFYSVQLASHKLLRWSTGWLLLILLGVSLVLHGQGMFYAIALWTQIAFYGCALLAFVSRNTSWARRCKPLAIPYYFCLVNLAVVRAWLRLLSGKRLDVWTSQRGPASTPHKPDVAAEVVNTQRVSENI